MSTASRSLVLFAALLGACGSAQTGKSTRLPGPKTNVLRATDVAPFRDAEAAVHTLRRHWVAGRDGSRTATPPVFVDGILMMGHNALEQLPAHQVVEIRYLSAIEATARFGNQFRSGVILVATTRPK